MYQHHNWQGALLDFPVNKVVCVGSNYSKHIQEMGSAGTVYQTGNRAMRYSPAAGAASGAGIGTP